MIDTSMFTVVRGAALLKAKGKEPRAIDNNGKPLGTHVKGISAGHLTPKHKPVSADAWLELSCAHGKDAETRPVLGKVWKQGEYAISTDGFRLHRTTEQVAGATVWTPRYENGNTPDFNELVRSGSAFNASVRTPALWAALHATLPFSRDSSNIVRFTCEQEVLTVSAVSWELGDVSVRLEGSDYTLLGTPFQFAMHNKYALDALRGMGATCNVGAASTEGNKPILFTHGERTALVMPMHISRD